METFCIDKIAEALAASAGNDFTVDTSKLVVEGDTGNVGIGTSTPNARLHVEGEESSNQGLKWHLGSNLIY
ncbi:MAG: hypothetical protein ACUZ8N_08995 [Candidatus Scalindua sp.]